MSRNSSLAAVAAMVAAGVLAVPVCAEDLVPTVKAPAEAATAQGAAQDPRDKEIADLKKLVEELRSKLSETDALRQVVEQLTKRIEALESSRPAPAEPAAPVKSGSATLLPNISVIGNLVARAGDSPAIPGRGRSHFEELEIAFQDSVGPKLRYDVYLSAEKEEEWGVGLEEGYLTASALYPGLTLRAGRIRTPFGRFNPLHPHQWSFITQPSAASAFLGHHGLVSDGAVAEYLLPIRGLYSSVQFGAWQTTSIHAHEHEPGEPENFREELGFRGGEHGAYSTRALFAKELGRNRDLELGFSRYWGNGDVEDFGRKRLAVTGADLTYRRYFGGDRRLQLLAEALMHETQDIDGETKRRLGGFLTAAYRWNRHWEGGLRGDYTTFPFPFDGHEWGGSLFLTKYLTEQTSLRLEYRHSHSPDFGGANGLFFQLLFGSGPHVHFLQ
jgi:hypothetical protein